MGVLVKYVLITTIFFILFFVTFNVESAYFPFPRGGSTGQHLRSGGVGAPTWTTATYPSTTTAPSVIVSNTSNSIVELNASTGNRILRTNGSAVSWAQVDLTTDVTGVLPHANGGCTASTYTATLTNSTNVAASTFLGANYIRCGNFVTVAVTINVDPTSSGTNTEIEVSLPVSSNLTSQYDVIGHCNNGGDSARCIVTGDATNDRAETIMTPAVGGNENVVMVFQYQIK